MKKILLYTGIIAMGAAAAMSCNLNNYPVFDDNDAFAAFDVLEDDVTEPEKGKTVIQEIPVTLASVAGLQATVSFTVAPENDSTGAVEGTDYRVLNEGKTLSFNAEQRTDYVRIEVLDNTSGVVNTDKAFVITLTGGSQNISIGAENVCEVTITDRDDLRNPVVGSYKITLADAVWDMKVTKDADNAEQVLFSNLCNLAAANLPTSTAFAGTIVRDEKDPNKAITTIEIELGQASGGDAPLTLVGAESLGGYAYDIVDEGTLVVKITSDANGSVLTFEASEDGYPLIAVMDGEGNVYAAQKLPLVAKVPAPEK